MGQLCGKCMKLLQDFVSFVKRMSSSLVQRIKQCLVMISECSCLKRNGSEARQLYKPVLQPHEKETAQEFLQHIETGFEMSLLGKNSLEALRTLAFSENPGLQQSAGLYYLHLSQHLTSQLPEEHLEPYYALLQSSDVEVQQMSSLSLVNFLLEGNINGDLVVQMGLLEPILELLELGDFTVQCNACACIMTLAASEWIQQVLCREGALPVLTLLLESPDAEVQYYSCTALSNLAANSHHHEAMLRTGDGFLLRTLISLLSSSVEKVSSQACVCLRNLAVSAHIQADIIAMDVLPQLLSLLASNSTDVQQASIALLWKLSQHPANQIAAFMAFPN